MASVGGAIADSLVRLGVSQFFTVPGESFMPLLERLAQLQVSGRARIVTTRHEGGAGFMAEAHGQLTGRPAGLLVTRAPGATNAAIAIHTARQNSTAMIVIAGQVPSKWRGREAFQEADLVQTIGGLAKWATELTAGADLTREVEKLHEVATSGRPGPVLLSAPQDLLAATYTLDEATEAPKSDDPVPAREVEATTRAVAHAVHKLKSAARPAIVAGGGVVRTNATHSLIRLAEALEVPVFADWRHPDAYPNDHRLYAGVVGVWADETLRTHLRECDVVLAIGTRISQMTSLGYTFPAPNALLIHVDEDPRFAHSPALRLATTPAAFVEAAITTAHASQGQVTRRAVRARALRAAYEASLVPPPLADGWVDPGRVATILSQTLPASSILTSDAGNFSGWVERHLTLPPGGRYLAPTSGAMGYAIPSAVAASLHAPDRTVVAMCGDGGFAMTMNELETAVRLGTRPLILVFDNDMYGTIRSHAGEGHAAVTALLGRWDAAAVARAAGAYGVTASAPHEVEPALASAMEQPLPAVVHLLCGPRAMSVT